ncbi:S1C family serine protease [Virgibacillus sediminis]|uniref:S1C family serine protease n=1 Tax=Virgibacillus sediminis TaxID=202260 RepID=A0ABV7ABP0_9BACI
MRSGRFLPILISAFIFIAGILMFLVLHQQWEKKEIAVNNPIIQKVNTESQKLDLKSIIHESEKNVLQIEGQSESSTKTGSGFLYNERGDIITNAHVINEADVIYARTADAQVYPAAVVGSSEEIDIAVIRVPQLAGQNYASVEKTETAEIGDEVIALGSPHGFQSTVTLGIISGAERNFSVDGYTYSNAYQISAPITHGNSGGPLINRYTGEVIGINSVGTADGTIGFSIPLPEVIEQIEQWSNEVQNDELEFAQPEDVITSLQPESIVEDAEYLVDYFLDSIAIRDYVNAYTLLGSSLQMKWDYSDFRDRYIQIVDINYSEMSSNMTENNSISMQTEIEIESNQPNQEQTKHTTNHYEFHIGYENDQLKILDIKVEET